MSAGEQIIQGPCGDVQVLAESPENAACAVALICHPHPLYGGTLTNKVVHQLARTFIGLNAHCVRFNFRGVGNSQGLYDEGRGEVDDLLAVADWAANQYPDLPVWLAGFSFGGFVALQGAAALKPAWLVTVAPAVSFFPADGISLPDTPWLLVQGTADEVVPTQQVLDWVETLRMEPDIKLVDGASHFFHGQLNDLKQSVEDSFPGY